VQRSTAAGWRAVESYSIKRGVRAVHLPGHQEGDCVCMCVRKDSSRHAAPRGTSSGYLTSTGTNAADLSLWTRPTIPFAFDNSTSHGVEQSPGAQRHLCYMHLTLYYPCRFLCTLLDPGRWHLEVSQATRRSQGAGRRASGRLPRPGRAGPSWAGEAPFLGAIAAGVLGRGHRVSPATPRLSLPASHLTDEWKFRRGSARAALVLGLGTGNGVC